MSSFRAAAGSGPDWLSACNACLEGLGPDAPFLGGALAATVVTFFTFLPSFVLIFAGGPLIETTHGKLAFTAPLTAITAAVVGVILNLALFFTWHIWWPAGFDGPFDAVSATTTVLAALALFRLKVGVMGLSSGSCPHSRWRSRHAERRPCRCRMANG
jgi:chromate transporter